jgi:hypothetical protein
LQSVHASGPAAGLNFPAEHGVNEPLPCPLYPALATQAAIAVLEAGEIELVGQLAQTVTPVVSE